MNTDKPPKEKPDRSTRQRMPYGCKVFLWMALTYYGIINLLFLGMLLFSGRIRKATEPWFDSEGISNVSVLLFIISGLMILFMCTSGLFLFLKQRKGGYYLFLSGAAFLWIADFFLLEFDWLRYLINSGFIFILGVFHFSGKCYKNRRKNDVD